MANGGTIRVEMDEAEFRLVGPGGEEGSIVGYGETAALKVGPEVFYCCIEDPDTGSPEVFRVDSVTPVEAEVEDVSFTDPDEESDDEEEEEEGDGDGDGEEETVIAEEDSADTDEEGEG